jgi:hypothetical protein
MRTTTHISLALALFSATPLMGQDHDHQHGTERLGRVIFPVSCKPVAQQRFERAMAMLHSFWWEEAPKEFRSALQADPSCAMAHWGLAINSWGNPFTGGPVGDDLKNGAAAASQAGQLGAPTPRERGFIAAVEALYRDHATVPAAVRMRAYSDTMARVYADHRTDPEVSLYYALSLIATASPTDTTFARQKQAAAILNPLFARHPDHPGLAHYIIHANDSPRLADLGLEAARRYAQIAPAAPHAQHMPSHIFIRLGLWEETIAANRRSYDAGIQYVKDQGMQGAWYHEFHALDYMAYGYLQEGRDSAARAIVNEGLAIKVIRGPTPLTRSYNRTSMQARLPLERSDWEAASRFTLTDSATPFNQMLTHFTRGIGAARTGKIEAAREEVAGLERIERALAERGDMNWSRVAGIKREAVQAWVLLASGDTAGALAAATAAANREDVTEKHPITPGELLPARELEADMHLVLKHYSAARASYLAVLTRERGRARAIFGAARAAELAGDKVAAAKDYQTFLTQMAKADAGRPELAIARAAVGTGSR